MTAAKGFLPQVQPGQHWSLEVHARVLGKHPNSPAPVQAVAKPVFSQNSAHSNPAPQSLLALHPRAPGARHCVRGRGSRRQE